MKLHRDTRKNATKRFGHKSQHLAPLVAIEGEEKWTEPAQKMKEEYLCPIV